MTAKEKNLGQIDESYIKKGAGKISDEDIRRVSEKADEIEEKFKSAGPLKRFMEDLRLLIAIVKDYWSGEYREIPYMSIAAIVFALLYVLSPMDIIPDVIPVVGYLDDAAVVAICLRLVEEDLYEYKEWKEKRAVA